MPSWQMPASIFLVIKMSFSTSMLCGGHPRVCFGKVIRLNNKHTKLLYVVSIKTLSFNHNGYTMDR